MAGKKPTGKTEQKEKKIVIKVLAPEKAPAPTDFSLALPNEVMFKSLSKRAAAVKKNIGASQSLSDFLNKAGWE